MNTHRKLSAVLCCTALLFVSLSCQLLSGAEPTAVPLAQDATVAVQEATAPQPTPTEDLTAATQEAEKALEATRQAESLQATQEAEAQATQEAVEVLELTAEVEVAATEQAAAMYGVIEELQADGVLEKTQGAYYRLDDFEENWAQIDWYQWWGTGYAPSDFVLTAHTSWESASRVANWFSSGCGFVFRETDENNHYMIYLALDGNVYLKGYVDSKFYELGKGYVGKVDFMEGEADVILVVEGDQVAYYVNGEKVFDRTADKLDSGNLALTLVSGTNKDFGTRCSITDVQLWDLSE